MAKRGGRGDLKWCWTTEEGGSVEVGAGGK